MSATEAVVSREPGPIQLGDAAAYRQRPEASRVVEGDTGTIFGKDRRLQRPQSGIVSLGHLAGMKSYGRASSFLAMTGYEQVRSVVADIVGDHTAAKKVELTLPESGVCGGSGLFDAVGVVPGRIV